MNEQIGNVTVRLNNGEDRLIKAKGNTQQECERAAYITAFGNEEGEADDATLVAQYCKFQSWA